MKVDIDVKVSPVEKLRSGAKRAGTVIMNAKTPSLHEVVTSLRAGVDRVRETTAEARLKKLADTYANLKVAGLGDTPMAKRVLKRIGEWRAEINSKDTR